MFKITEFLDLIHHPVLSKLGNTTFQKLDVFILPLT
jgi:hypothetical protein